MIRTRPWMQPPHHKFCKLFFLSSFHLPMARKQLTNGQKLKIVSETAQRLASGESLRAVARSYAVDPSQIRKWRAKAVQLAQTKRSKKSLATGRKGRLKDHEEELMEWAFDLRGDGTALTYFDLVRKAIEVCPDFGNLTKSQQYHSVRRLCLSNCFLKRRFTHISQRLPQETEEESQQWLQVMRPIVSAPNVQKKFVLNMDQTPMYFSMAPVSTLNLQGARTVYGRRSGESGGRFTVSCTISANGDKLKPFIIFKGEEFGRIATREFPANPERDRVILCAQKSAWQDEDNMVTYCDKVLVPYLQEKAQGVPCLLLLDAFSAHWTAQTTAKMEEIGITTYKIPPGCTYLTQPIDVGIGKPFKDRVRSFWWEWMQALGADNATFASPSRETGTKWVADSWDSIPADIVRNAWRKTDFSYFVDE